jgi:hypothetical protein
VDSTVVADSADFTAAVDAVVKDFPSSRNEPRTFGCGAFSFRQKSAEREVGKYGFCAEVTSVLAVVPDAGK